MFSQERFGRRTEEQFRRASSKATELIARQYGDHFPMWIGCGFPKSGTVWLCRLMSNYLGVPFPQHYASPILMRSVVHAHWRYDARLPSTAYIYRDGRDVMVSLYFHQVRQMSTRKHPRNVAMLEKRYRSLFGSEFDPSNSRRNLATFLRAEFSDPAYGTGTWSAHIRDWMSEARPQVHSVSYEDLKVNPHGALSSLMTSITGEPADDRLVRLAVERNDFGVSSGRSAGQEDRSDPMRKGIVGDWRNHFTSESAHIFEEFAGSELRLLGYEPDSSWPHSVVDF